MPNSDPTRLSYLRRLYGALPSDLQSFARRGYNGLAAGEVHLIGALLDTGIIPTLDRSNLESRPDIEYYVYDEPERHTFVVPSVSGREHVMERAIRNRATWRDEITTIHDIDNHEYSIECHEPFVAELSDVTIFGPHAMARAGTGELPLEVKANIRSSGGSFDAMVRSTLRWFGRLNTAKTLVRPRRPAQQFDVAASILTGRKKTTPAYGHWLLEVLPRIRGIKHYEEQTGRQPTILINPNITDWQMETLELVGVDPENLTKWSGGTAAVDRYVLPIWAKSEWCASDIGWIRDQIKSRIDYEQHLGDSSSRVFLSREQMGRRRISNREEVMAEISPYGFETYTPESLSFPKQVALFEEAEILIGPTGGSFTNMIFSTDIDVIELFQPNHFITWFFELAQLLGQDYQPVFGEDVDEESSPNPHHQDFSISPDRVKEVLETRI